MFREWYARRKFTQVTVSTATASTEEIFESFLKLSKKYRYKLKLHKERAVSERGQVPLIGLPVGGVYKRKEVKYTTRSYIKLYRRVIPLLSGRWIYDKYLFDSRDILDFYNKHKDDLSDEDTSELLKIILQLSNNFSYVDADVLQSNIGGIKELKRFLRAILLTDIQLENSDDCINKVVYYSDDCTLVPLDDFCIKIIAPDCKKTIECIKSNKSEELYIVIYDRFSLLGNNVKPPDGGKIIIWNKMVVYTNKGFSVEFPTNWRRQIVYCTGKDIVDDYIYGGETRSVK